MKKHSLAAVLIGFLFSLFTVAGLSAEKRGAELTLVLKALGEHHPAFLGNESSLAAAQAGYLASRAALRPGINLSVPLSGSDYPYILTGMDMELRDLYYLSTSPAVQLSQLLPTAGVLTGSIQNTMAVSNYNEVSSILLERADPLWTNSLKVSLGMNQPLVFKGVYQATVARIERAYDTERLDYQSVRNNLTLQAVRDYYAWKQAAYQVTLIEARLRGDEETYRRIEREYELGLWTRTKLYQAQSVLLQSEADLLKAEQTLDAARRLLTVQYGMELPEKADTSVTELVAGSKPPEAFIEAALAENPELRALRNSIEGARADLLLKEKDHAPVLEANLSYNYEQDLSESDDSSHSLTFSLGLNASLSDGGAFRESQKQRTYLLAALDSQLREKEAAIRARITSLQAALKRGSRLVELYTLQEQAVGFDYESGKIDYDLGRITEKDLMDRRLDLENAQLSIQSGIIENNITLLELYALTGTDIFQWLITETAE